MAFKFTIFKLFKKEKKNKKRNKIFIDRSDSRFKHFQIQDQNSIIKYLKTKNFSIVKLSDLTFYEQIYLFNNAKVIVGPMVQVLLILYFVSQILKYMKL